MISTSERILRKLNMTKYDKTFGKVVRAVISMKTQQLEALLNLLGPDFKRELTQLPEYRTAVNAMDKYAQAVETRINYLMKMEGKKK